MVCKLSDFVWLCQLDEMNGMIVGQTYRPLSDFVWLCQLDEMNGMIVGQTYRPLSDFVWLCQLDEMKGMIVGHMTCPNHFVEFFKIFRIQLFKYFICIRVDS
jgi:hypothetical protein